MCFPSCFHCVSILLCFHLNCAINPTIITTEGQVCPSLSCLIGCNLSSCCPWVNYKSTLCESHHTKPTGPTDSFYSLPSTQYASTPSERMQPTRLANACGDASPATKTRRQMKPKTASQHQSEPDEATDSSVEASSGRCTPAVVGMPPPLASAVLPPQILTVDAGYVALSWSPPIWDVSTDNTVVYGVRYRVLIATVLGNADTRVEDVQCYQCVYEGIETSTQVRLARLLAKHFCASIHVLTCGVYAHRWLACFLGVCMPYVSATAWCPCTILHTCLTSSSPRPS